MLCTKKEIIIAWNTYQHCHVFHVATRQKVDFDDSNFEKYSVIEIGRVLFLKFIFAVAWQSPKQCPQVSYLVARSG